MSAFAQWALGLVLGTLGGAFGTFLTFRGRLDMMQRDIADERRARESLESKIGDKLVMLERRSLLMLQITVDIARQTGVDQRRFDDKLVRMLSETDSTEER